MLSTALRLAAAVLAAAGLPGAQVPAVVVHQDQVARARAEQVLEGLSLPQRVGQLFMVGTPAVGSTATVAQQVRRYHVGNVMLTGRSHAGLRATARITGGLRARTSDAATGDVGMLVATDQEGGQVQVLQGPGFSGIPSALWQGEHWAPSRLRTAARTWARQLAGAGVDVDLAPVADTVPGPGAAGTNPPIGASGREFGFTPRVVGNHARAFARGMADGGVLATVKHFPGLGRVSANTDTSSGVTDSTTRRHGPFLAPFRRAVEAGVPLVMMSTAYYPRMDAHHPAAFSRYVIGEVLRGDLGFRGVVVSDDLGIARQVASWPPGRRAVEFVRAGGDLVLTVAPDTLPAMYHAVLHRARHHAAFRRTVDRAALRVLHLKAGQGLLGDR
ncbi:MAG: glycoside hydrolase family 3 N-terminal domain-containing protein [Marmoricola sp.]